MLNLCLKIINLSSPIKIGKMQILTSVKKIIILIPKHKMLHSESLQLNQIMLTFKVEAKIQLIHIDINNNQLLHLIFLNTKIIKLLPETALLHLQKAI
jgi:hypothetical protein